MGNTDVALHSLDAPDVTRGCLQEITKASERGRELVRQILSVGRPRATDLRLTSITPVVEESIQLLRSTLPAQITLTLECRENLPRLLIDSTQIVQVVINLVTNAVQAINGQPGKIHIAVDSISLDAEMRERMPQLANSSNEFDQVLRMVVSDNGPGMSAMTASRLFEPFYTTKPDGEGPGLGLTIVSGIVRTHHGAIAVDSKPGNGATFTIYLPATADVANAQQDTELEQAAPQIDVGTEPQVVQIDNDPVVSHSVVTRT